MGGKKQVELAFEHMSTNINIKKSPICANCPYRLYAGDAENVTLGTGNIYSNFIFVLPTYDIKANIGYENLLSLLSKAYTQIIGKSLFEDAYITRLVKCSKINDHNIYSSCIGPCSNFLIYELNKLKAHNVVFFGSAYNDYLYNSDVVGLNIPMKVVHQIYSPAVLLYDNIKFKEKFINDLSAILNNN